MPNPHPKLPPRPLSNREKGTDRHLKEKGIDPELFKGLVRAELGPAPIIKVIKSHTGVEYSATTVSDWIKQLKDEWKAEVA